MTKRESAIVGAYTGILCGPFGALHAYVEELLGRPVWTHELGDRDTAERIKELARADFIALAQAVCDDEA